MKSEKKSFQMVTRLCELLEDMLELWWAIDFSVSVKLCNLQLWSFVTTLYIQKLQMKYDVKHVKRFLNWPKKHFLQ